MKTQRRTTRSNKWYLRKGKGLHPSEGRATLLLKVFLKKKKTSSILHLRDLSFFVFSVSRTEALGVTRPLRKEGSNAEKCLLFSRSLSVFFRGGGSSEIPSTWQRVTTQGPLEGEVWGGGRKVRGGNFWPGAASS